MLLPSVPIAASTILPLFRPRQVRASGVSFQITTVPSTKNMVFGGDGIFLAALTGPGKIWLQTLPIVPLAHEIIEYMPAQQRQPSQTVEGGVVDGIVGSILDNMR